MTKRYFFIGDIHGCADELEALLKKINKKKSDEIICVGDLVNKGPFSDRVVDLLREAKAQSVMGNHDFIIKSIYDERENGLKSPIKLKKKHYKLYESLSKKNIEYIRKLPFYIILDEIKTIVVHGGIKPNTSLEKNTSEELTCIRIVDPVSKEFVKRDQKGLPWYYFYSGEYRVVYGHKAMNSIQINKNTVGIDTGCLYGNKLSAYCLPDDYFISVKAKKAYEDYTQKGKYRMPR